MEQANDPAREKAPAPTRVRWVSVLIVAALFLIGLVQSLTGAKGGVTTEINDQYLGVSGTYGSPVFLKLDAITDVRLAESFDFGACVDGEETGNTVSGTYSCEEYGTYTAHAYTEGPYIIVGGPDGVLVFNCGSRSNTEKMYGQLVQASAP